MPAVKAIVFDIDDTLYLERDYVRSGFQAVGQWFDAHGGIPGFADTCWTLYEKGHRGTVFNDAGFEHGHSLDPQCVRELVRVYREHVPTIVLDPSASRVLDTLRGRGPTAVITGGPVIPQVRKVTALGLASRVRTIVYAGSWGIEHDKPAERAWLQTELLLGLPGEELAYVGDNPAKDFPAPLSRGWTCYRVRYEGSEHRDVETPRGVRELSSLLELNDLRLSD